MIQIGRCIGTIVIINAWAKQFSSAPLAFDNKEAPQTQVCAWTSAILRICISENINLEHVRNIWEN